MKYKVQFFDKNGIEFMGTTRSFVTDGRYSLDTIKDIAIDRKNKLWIYNNSDIAGYNIYKDSFNNSIYKTVTL
jgi:hypothetical protein